MSRLQTFWAAYVNRYGEGVTPRQGFVVVVIGLAAAIFMGSAPN